METQVEVLAGRMLAAMDDSAVRARAMLASTGFGCDGELTAGEVFKFIWVTGLDARFLLCGLEDALGSLDDFRSLDVHGSRYGDET